MFPRAIIDWLVDLYMKLNSKCLPVVVLILNIIASNFLLVLPVQALLSKNSCLYYEEVKAQWHCGPAGYIESFAQPYCESYLRHRNDFSPHAQRVLKNIRHCLQTYLNENFTGTSCQQLEDSGIASHEYCYLKHGYCELGVNDLIKVMWIAKSEILNAQMWRMFIHVHRQCKNTL